MKVKASVFFLVLTLT